MPEHRAPEPAARQPGPLRLSLLRAADLLARRLADLEPRLETDETAWLSYCAALEALATVAPHLEPGAHGELLTTAQMAERLGLAPKTLLKHKKAGAVKPALQRGKLIRWRGSEAVR